MENCCEEGNRGQFCFTQSNQNTQFQKQFMSEYDFQLNYVSDLHFQIGINQIKNTPVSGFGLILIKHMDTCVTFGTREYFVTSGKEEIKNFKGYAYFHCEKQDIERIFFNSQRQFLKKGLVKYTRSDHFLKFTVTLLLDWRSIVIGVTREKGGHSHKNFLRASN